MQKRIVLIDDDPDELHLVKEALEAVTPHIECISFIYPDEAIRALLANVILVPNYIFIDINMPRKSGTECLLEIRDVPHLAAAKKVMYSTTMPPAAVQEMLRAGADHAFQKPVTMDDYIAILKNILG